MRPWVIVYATMSLDGCLANYEGYSKLSCRYDLERLHRLRSIVDGIGVGANTVRVDNPILTTRYVKGKSPVPVVFDGKLTIPVQSRLLMERNRVIIITTEKGYRSREDLKELPNVELIVAGKGPVIDLSIALDALAKKGIRRLLVEGGGLLLGSLLREGFIDELHITISPQVFGDNCVKIFRGTRYSAKDAPRLRLMKVNVCECGHEIHAIYEVVKPKRPLF